jgi:hypothetical protein
MCSIEDANMWWSIANVEIEILLAQIVSFPLIKGENKLKWQQILTLLQSNVYTGQRTNVSYILM